MALQHLGGISGAIVAPVNNYTTGSRVVGPETFPAGYSSVLVLVDLRQQTSAEGIITVQAEYSLDGDTWISAGSGGVNLSASGYTVVDGVLRNAEGGPVRLMGILLFIPRTDLSRAVRVVLSIDRPMRVGATLVGW